MIMDITKYYAIPGEKPLDNIPADGGFAGIFRTIGCIGDSLSSGEFESLDEAGNRGYHDMFEYSWGQYLGRLVGAKVYNFSRGGMTAIEYMQSFAEANGFWGEDKLCQCYIMALGVNDLFGRKMPLGSVADICVEDYTKNNTETFAGWYAQVMQRIRTMQPKARFFLMTMLHEGSEEHDRIVDEHASLLHDIAAMFEFTYVIDFAKYAPVYDAEFRRNFYLGGHLNAAGYLLTSRMVAAYMDYIIRNNPDDFTQVGFIGHDFHNHSAKW